MVSRTFGLSTKEFRLFRLLDTPRKVQDWLERIPINAEKSGDTCISPRRVIQERHAHCIEGAMFAALAFWIHGGKPYLLDLKAADRDFDHVVAPFRHRAYWGAVSKTNHAVLRYREPIYKTIRELACSYFHEYFMDDGKKTLRSYSEPFDLTQFRKRNWMTAQDNLWYIPTALDRRPHKRFLTPHMVRMLRPADPIEIMAGKLVEWADSGKRRQF